LIILLIVTLRYFAAIWFGLLRHQTGKPATRRVLTSEFVMESSDEWAFVDSFNQMTVISTQQQKLDEAHAALQQSS
jgi:hypothetical protein